MLQGQRISLRPVRESDLGAFFNGGRNQDLLLYSLLRTDPRPWHGT